jgi:hypothetical protein
MPNGAIPISAKRLADNVVNACDQLAAEIARRCFIDGLPADPVHDHAKRVLIDWMLGNYKLKD